MRPDDILIAKGEYTGPHFQDVDDYVTGKKQAPPPCWARDIDGQLMLRCKCGLWMRLNHRVLKDGEVHPSIHHPLGDWTNCGWHIWGTLKDFDGKEQ